MQLSKKEIRDFAKHFSLNENDVADFVSQYNSEGGKKGLWPEKNGWWQSTKWIQELSGQYKFLVPILSALHDHRAIGQNRTSDIVTRLYSLNDEEYQYVLLDLSKTRKLVAGQAGCSQKTLSLYIRGLVSCGVLRYFPCGRKKYYSLRYWVRYPVDPKNLKGDWDYKKSELLTKKTSNLLREFKLPK